MSSLEQKFKKLQQEHELLKSQVEDSIKLPDETWQTYATRTYKSKKNFRNQVKAIFKYASDCEEKLPEDFKATIKSLSGQKWPSTMKPCLGYNGGSCEKQWYHKERISTKDGLVEMDRVHICAICNRIAEM